MANLLDSNHFESTQLNIINDNNDNHNTIILILVISFSVIASMLMKTRRANKLLHSLTSIFQENRDMYSITKLSLVEEEEEESVEVVECVVCLCRVTSGESYKTLPNCNHGFHARCIDAWLKRHATCPLCRSSVTSISYCSIMNQDNVELFDVLFSRIVRVVDHFRAWLVDPISPSMESALGQNCLSFI